MAARFRPLELGTAGLIVVLDQIVKAVVRDALTLFESRTVVPGVFDLTRIHNTGTAFGLFNAVDLPFKTAVLSVVAGAALVGLAWYAASLPPAQRLARFGLALVLGGAAGNLIDRLAYGFVLDFFDFYWRGWHFWAFNVADAAITVGVALLVLDMLIAPRARAVPPHA